MVMSCLCGLWSIWKKRNEIVWNVKLEQADAELNRAKFALADWLNAG